MVEARVVQPDPDVRPRGVAVENMTAAARVLNGQPTGRDQSIEKRFCQHRPAPALCVFARVILAELPGRCHYRERAEKNGARRAPLPPMRW
jgi:hypothetical protein